MDKKIAKGYKNIVDCPKGRVFVPDPKGDCAAVIRLGSGVRAEVIGRFVGENEVERYV
jgi:hypothetical protein